MARTGFLKTPPRGRGGTQAVLFTIDKTGYFKGASQAGRELKKLEKDIIKNLKQGEYAKTVRVRQKLEGRIYVDEVLVASLDKSLNEVANEVAKSLAAQGKSYFRNIVKTAPNKHKEPGRYETGYMLSKVQGRTINRKNYVTVGVGWDIAGNGDYFRYFSFQEEGARGGPMPMNAIPKTTHFITTKFRQEFEAKLKARLDSIK